MDYFFDDEALAKDMNLGNFHPDLGTFQAQAETETGGAIVRALCSRAGCISLSASIAAAPSRPAVVAIEHLLATQVGEKAFTREMKQLTGRIVRHIVEHLGGRWIRSGVPITVRSRYSKGSIYDFGTRIAREAA